MEKKSLLLSPEIPRKTAACESAAGHSKMGDCDCRAVLARVLNLTGRRLAFRVALALERRVVSVGTNGEGGRAHSGWKWRPAALDAKRAAVTVYHMPSLHAKRKRARAGHDAEAACQWPHACCSAVAGSAAKASSEEKGAHCRRARRAAARCWLD